LVWNASGQVTLGAEADFAGIRTFTLLGGLAGVAGWLWTLGFQPVAIVLLAGATALVVAAYVAASRRVVDGTTEVAAPGGISWHPVRNWLPRIGQCHCVRSSWLRSHSCMHSCMQ